MKADTRYDVVIVGAGPAGALTGYLLALKNIKVLIIDKKAYPRYKACGGGITRRAGSLLPFDFSPVIEDKTFTVKLLFKDQTLFDRTMDQPITWMVMRNRFDNYIVEQAVKNGAVFQDQTAFISLSGKPGDLSVKTSGGHFAARLVVGADGVNTQTAKALGLTLKRDTMVAVEGEVYPDDPDALHRFQGSTHYDFGVVPKGYGWIFPKKDHLSIGVGSFSGKLDGWRQTFNDYCTLKNISPKSRIHPLKGHLIPCHPKKGDVLGKPEGLLVGDAAGITDPITGEGIYYAFKGAEIASRVIAESLASGYGNMSGYSGLMHSEFLHDMVCANRLSCLLYGFPRFSRLMLKRFGETLGDNMVRVIAGEQTYTELYGKALSLGKVVSTVLNS